VTPTPGAAPPDAPLPLLDRRGPRALRRRPFYLFLVMTGIAAFIILTVMGMF
jgi:quinol-cytochrome oxidoreductase complex cytochrome b subunit